MVDVAATGLFVAVDVGDAATVDEATESSGAGEGSAPELLEQAAARAARLAIASNRLPCTVLDTAFLMLLPGAADPAERERRVRQALEDHAPR